MKHIEVFRYSQIFIEEWAVYHRNIYLITLHGTKATGHAPVVLSVIQDTDVLCILFGGYWLFCRHQVKHLFGLKHYGCFQ